MNHHKPYTHTHTHSRFQKPFSISKMIFNSLNKQVDRQTGRKEEKKKALSNLIIRWIKKRNNRRIENNCFCQTQNVQHLKNGLEILLLFHHTSHCKCNRKRKKAFCSVLLFLLLSSCFGHCAMLQVENGIWYSCVYVHRYQHSNCDDTEITTSLQTNKTRHIPNDTTQKKILLMATVYSSYLFWFFFFCFEISLFIHNWKKQ